MTVSEDPSGTGQALPDLKMLCIVEEVTSLLFAWAGINPNDTIILITVITFSLLA